MRGVAIVSPVRTAVGSFGGSLRGVPAATLGEIVIKELFERTGLDPAKVDDVILGHAYPSGEAPSIGRLCALKAGLPIEVPGYQLDRRCSSGLQAIINAAMVVQTENADVVIAGGVESMSNSEFYTNEARWGARFGSISLHDRLGPRPGDRLSRRAIWIHLRHDRDWGEPGQAIRDLPPGTGRIRAAQPPAGGSGGPGWEVRPGNSGRGPCHSVGGTR